MTRAVMVGEAGQEAYRGEGKDGAAGGRHEQRYNPRAQKGVCKSVSTTD